MPAALHATGMGSTCSDIMLAETGGPAGHLPLEQQWLQLLGAAQSQVVGWCLLRHEVCVGCQDGTPQRCLVLHNCRRGALCAAWDCCGVSWGLPTCVALEGRLVASVGCSKCALLRQWLAVHA